MTHFLLCLSCLLSGYKPNSSAPGTDRQLFRPPSFHVYADFLGALNRLRFQHLFQVLQTGIICSFCHAQHQRLSKFEKAAPSRW
jgi:hypothetical protein